MLAQKNTPVRASTTIVTRSPLSNRPRPRPAPRPRTVIWRLTATVETYDSSERREQYWVSRMRDVHEDEIDL